jgi:hypothetical protein
MAFELLRNMIEFHFPEFVSQKLKTPLFTAFDIYLLDKLEHLLSYIYTIMTCYINDMYKELSRRVIFNILYSILQSSTNE